MVQGPRSVFVIQTVMVSPIAKMDLNASNMRIIGLQVMGFLTKTWYQDVMEPLLVLVCLVITTIVLHQFIRLTLTTHVVYVSRNR